MASMGNDLKDMKENLKLLKEKVSSNNFQLKQNLPQVKISNDYKTVN